MSNFLHFHPPTSYALREDKKLEGENVKFFTFPHSFTYPPRVDKKEGGWKCKIICSERKPKNR